MPTPIRKGTANVIWGSANALGTPAGAIVESIKVTAKNQKPVEIEDNDGFAAVLIFLKDGFDADISVVYDANKTWPAVGDTVVLQLPKVGGIGGTENFNCYLQDITPDMARKREAMLTVSLTHRPGVLA